LIMKSLTGKIMIRRKISKTCNCQFKTEVKAFSSSS
jgi:hypothetical protein